MRSGDISPATQARTDEISLHWCLDEPVEAVRCAALASLTPFLAACNFGADPATGPTAAPAMGSGGDSLTPSDTAPANALIPSFSTVSNSPFLRVGEDKDFPGRLEFDLPAAGPARGPFVTNTLCKFGSGIHGVTGPVANTPTMTPTTNDFRWVFTSTRDLMSRHVTFFGTWDSQRS